MTGILFGPDLGQDGRELGLLLGGRRRGGAAGGRRGGGSGGRRGGGDAVALLELLDELGQLEDGHAVDRLEDLVLGQGGHGVGLLPLVGS